MNNNNPLVSIIMSVYNAEATLCEAIDSIIAQTYRNWQFVICNDCSSDGTIQILQDYQERYPDKFVIFSNSENHRLSYSLNRCLQYADGDYIARMDGDDISAPDRIEKQLGFLQSHKEYQLVGTAMRRFDEDGKHDVVRCSEKPCKEELRYGVTFCHATIMMYKTVFEQIGGYTEASYTKRSQDYDLWFKFYYKGFQGYNLPDDLYLVREDLNAIKRRNLSDRVCIFRIQLKGYKLLHFPLFWYITPLVQVLKALIPSNLYGVIRKHQFKRNT